MGGKTGNGILKMVFDPLNLSGLFTEKTKTSFSAPALPDFEAERRKAEETALKKRQAAAEQGMSGSILGGAVGDEVKKKKLLGE